MNSKWLRDCASVCMEHAHTTTWGHRVSLAGASDAQYAIVFVAFVGSSSRCKQHMSVQKWHFRRCTKCPKPASACVHAHLRQLPAWLSLCFLWFAALQPDTALYKKCQSMPGSNMPCEGDVLGVGISPGTRHAGVKVVQAYYA